MDNKSLPVLMDEPPTLVYPSLAKALGINHAILFQQLHFLLSITRKAKNKHNFVEGRWWVYNTAAQWQDEYFPWLHANTIARLFRDLEEKGLVLSRQSVRNSSDRTKWYTIDYQAWHTFSQTIATNCDDEPSEQFNQMVATNCDDGYSETTTDKEITLAPRAKRGRKKQVDQAQPPLIAPDSPPDDLPSSTQHDPGQSANIAPAAEAPAKPRRPRAPNPLYDAVAEAFDIPPEAGGRIGKICTQLQGKGQAGITPPRHARGSSILCPMVQGGQEIRRSPTQSRQAPTLVYGLASGAD